MTHYLLQYSGTFTGRVFSFNPLPLKYLEGDIEESKGLSGLKLVAIFKIKCK